jgi:hypothetical protein
MGISSAGLDPLERAKPVSASRREALTELLPTSIPKRYLVATRKDSQCEYSPVIEAVAGSDFSREIEGTLT